MAEDRDPTRSTTERQTMFFTVTIRMSAAFRWAAMWAPSQRGRKREGSGVGGGGRSFDVFEAHFSPKTGVLARN